MSAGDDLAGAVAITMRLDPTPLMLECCGRSYPHRWAKGLSEIDRGAQRAAQRDDPGAWTLVGCRRRRS